LRICIEYKNGDRTLPLQRSLIGWATGTLAGGSGSRVYGAAKRRLRAAAGTMQR
jgi:hypothetical protein